MANKYCKAVFRVALGMMALMHASGAAHAAGMVHVTVLPRQAQIGLGESVTLDIWADWSGVTGGLSTVVTAGAQGALAWYATLLVGRAAQRWLAGGKSWGEHGPKRVVTEIVESLDRDSVLREAREEILRRVRGGKG